MIDESHGSEGRGPEVASSGGVRAPSARPVERVARVLGAIGEGGGGGGGTTALAPPRARRFDPEVARRLLRGREAGARLGKHQSGTAPFGYVRDYSARRRGEKGIPLRIEPAEAEIVRAIFALYLRLCSMKRVIERLNASGARTRRGKEWSRAGIAWILKNETYLGRVHFGAIRARGEHEALVDPRTFARVQKLIRRNDKRGRARRRPGALG